MGLGRSAEIIINGLVRNWIRQCVRWIKWEKEIVWNRKNKKSIDRNRAETHEKPAKIEFRAETQKLITYKMVGKSINKFWYFQSCNSKRSRLIKWLKQSDADGTRFQTPFPGWQNPIFNKHGNYTSCEGPK